MVRRSTNEELREALQEANGNAAIAAESVGMEFDQYCRRLNAITDLRPKRHRVADRRTGGDLNGESTD